MNIFHEKSADQYEDAGAVRTQRGAKTLAFDSKTKKIFLPTAEYLESKDPSSRPQPKPGTFMVLVVGR